MPLTRRRLHADDEPLRSALARLRVDLDVPGPFDAAVTSTAERATDRFAADRADATDLPLLAVDPPGARDLDQAFALEHHENGWTLHYAIADVAAFVVPGDVVDLESRRRGSTLYLPDGKAPLHPPVLSEGAASLLPGEDRPAVHWKLGFDASAELRSTEVTRALVRVRLATSYESITAVLGNAVARPTRDDALDLQDPTLDVVGEAQNRGVDLRAQAEALRDFGRLRMTRQSERGGVSLTLPEQDVTTAADGTLDLEIIPASAAEEWNAQLSLATGIAAAQLMLSSGTGLLRTLPEPDDRTLGEIRHASRALGVAWPRGGYAAWVRSLDPSTPVGASLMLTAAKGLRGAGYAAFDGTVPKLTTHAAVASPYAHVTAPLRRLGDRYATELALAAADGRRPDTWTLEALTDLPAILDDANRRSNSVDRAVVDLFEAVFLQGAVGRRFRAVVLSSDRGRARVQITDPPVIADARLDGRDVKGGDALEVVLTAADPMNRSVSFDEVG